MRGGRGKGVEEKLIIVKVMVQYDEMYSHNIGHVSYC